MKLVVGALISIGIVSSALYASAPQTQGAIADRGFSLAWVSSGEHLMSPRLCAEAATPAGIKIQWHAKPCGWSGRG
jgi:hypothetical protein